MTIDPRHHIVYCVAQDDLLTEIAWRKPTAAETKDFYVDKAGHIVKLNPAPFVEFEILVSDFKNDKRTKQAIADDVSVKSVKRIKDREAKKEKK